MNFTATDFERYSQEDDNEEPLDDALVALALNVDVDAVDEVRERRERI